MRGILFVTLWLAAFASDASAQSGLPGHPFLVLSDGQSTCGEYIAEPAKRGFRTEWVLGYISGANSRGLPAEAHAGSSFQMPATVDGWLLSYCTSHPLEGLVLAAEVLRRDFLAREGRR
jgi:hypothetical protein